LLALHALGEFLASGLAVPFLERLVRDFPLDEKLRELSTLRLTLEWHTRSGALLESTRPSGVDEINAPRFVPFEVMTQMFFNGLTKLGLGGVAVDADEDRARFS
jgi:hypothetical protein